jgi:hypothetical protein
MRDLQSNSLPSRRRGCRGRLAGVQGPCRGVLPGGLASTGASAQGAGEAGGGVGALSAIVNGVVDALEPLRDLLIRTRRKSE